MLIAALKVADTNAKPLIRAVYWLESAYVLEGASCGTGLLKNIGLSHVHLIQNKVLSKKKNKMKALKPPADDMFHTLQAMKWPNSTTE
jgi:hypothetical protein